MQINIVFVNLKSSTRKKVCKFVRLAGCYMIILEKHARLDFSVLEYFWFSNLMLEGSGAISTFSRCLSRNLTHANHNGPGGRVQVRAAAEARPEGAHVVLQAVVPRLLNRKQRVEVEPTLLTFFKGVLHFTAI